MSCVRAFKQFDWLVPSDAAEKLKSIRLSSTCVAEPLDATIERNKKCKFNSRSAARGKIPFRPIHGPSINRIVEGVFTADRK